MKPTALSVKLRNAIDSLEEVANEIAKTDERSSWEMYQMIVILSMYACQLEAKERS
jgi:hypothetical protein